MVEVTQSVSVVRSNATAKQEWRLSRVSLKYRPVVFLSAAAVAFAFRVEEKEVDMPLILFATFQVLSTGYADGFDDLYLWYDVGNKCPPQVVDHHGTLVAVKLHVAQMIVVHGGDNVLRHVVDEDADRFILFVLRIAPLFETTIIRNDPRIRRDALDVSRTLGVEDQTDEVHA